MKVTASYRLKNMTLMKYTKGSVGVERIMHHKNKRGHRKSLKMNINVNLSGEKMLV